jgi:hypothetical protein
LLERTHQLDDGRCVPKGGTQMANAKDGDKARRG